LNHAATGLHRMTSWSKMIKKLNGQPSFA
jgi:hypothetical protein